MALGPVQAFTGSNTKSQWADFYTSDNINKAFIGAPPGVYLGFVPVISGQLLTLKRDVALIYSVSSGTFTVGDTVTGGASGATAVIRVVLDPLPGRGFMLVDAVTGTFSEGETINAPGASATLDKFTSEDLSLAKVTTSSSLAGGRTEEALTVVIGEDVELDFSLPLITDGSYYVNLRASYEIGSDTSAEIYSIKDTPPDGSREVGICRVTKSGPDLTLDPIGPDNRSDPYADVNTRVGFMPGESIFDIGAALTTVQEVSASRTGHLGTNFGDFDPADSAATGLPGRLNSDLERAQMAARLGKKFVMVQGNDYTPQTIPSGNTFNISGSFAARARDARPFVDITNGLIPTGLPVPIVIDPEGIDGVELTLTGASGTFAVSDKLSGLGSGGAGVITQVGTDLLTVSDIAKSFYIGEQVSSLNATATVTGINLREGAITAPESGLGGDPVRNIVAVIDTRTGKRPINESGDTIYGRLLFGPSGSSGSGGGDPGELLVATNAGEQLNFTSGSVAVTSTNLDLTEYFLPGDIIEGDDGRFYEIDQATGSVQTGTLFLTTGKPYVGPSSSSGFGLGSGPRRRRRYTMKLVSLTGGVESDETITSDNLGTGGSLRVFFPTWLSRARSNHDAIMSLQTLGESHRVVGPGSTIPGIGYNASAGPATQLIGAVKQVQIGFFPQGAGNFHTINYSLAGVTPTLTETAPGEILIDATGPPGPIPPPGPAPPGPPGPQGSGFVNIFNTLAAREVTGSGVTSTETFNFFPKKVRFYMVTIGIKNASSVTTPAYISAVSPTPVYDMDTEVVIEYTIAPGSPNTSTIYCAVSTD